MKKDLFSSKKIIRTLAVLGAICALPVSAASASTGSTGSSSCTIFTTVQGTSVLGIELPVVGTQGETVTLPVSCSVVPQEVQQLLDFTATADVTLVGQNVAYVYVDPRMAH